MPASLLTDKIIDGLVISPSKMLRQVHVSSVSELPANSLQPDSISISLDDVIYAKIDHFSTNLSEKEFWTKLIALYFRLIHYVHVDDFLNLTFLNV